MEFCCDISIIICLIPFCQWLVCSERYIACVRVVILHIIFNINLTRFYASWSDGSSLRNHTIFNICISIDIGCFVDFRIFLQEIFYFNIFTLWTIWMSSLKERITAYGWFLIPFTVIFRIMCKSGIPSIEVHLSPCISGNNNSLILRKIDVFRKFEEVT